MLINQLPPKFFSLRIKTARAIKNLTQAELAQQSGIAQPQISKIEKGLIDSVSIEDLLKIGKVLNIGLDIWLESDTEKFLELINNQETNIKEESKFLKDFCKGNLELYNEFNNIISKFYITVDYNNTYDNMNVFKEFNIKLLKSVNTSEINNIINNKENFILNCKQSDFTFFNFYWQKLSNNGWMHIQQLENKIIIYQILINKKGHLIFLPLWETDESLFNNKILNNIKWNNLNPLFDYQSFINVINYEYQVIEDITDINNNLFYLGKTSVNNQIKNVAIESEILDNNLYISGQLGTGKGYFIKDNIINYLEKNNKNYTVFEKNKEYIDLDNKSSILDITKYYYNPLDIDNKDKIEYVCQYLKYSLMSLMHLNPDSAPRAVNYYEQVITALAQYNLYLNDYDKLLKDEIKSYSFNKNKFDLSDIITFFKNQELRFEILEKINNEAIKITFDPNSPFEKMGERQQIDHVFPIIKTLYQLIEQEEFKELLLENNHKNKLSFNDFIDNSNIVSFDSKLTVLDGSDFIVNSFLFEMFYAQYYIKQDIKSVNKNNSLKHYIIIDDFEIDVVKHLIDNKKVDLSFIINDNNYDNRTKDYLLNNIENKILFKQNINSNINIKKYLENKKYDIQEFVNLESFNILVDYDNKPLFKVNLK